MSDDNDPPVTNLEGLSSFTKLTYLEIYPELPKAYKNLKFLSTLKKLSLLKLTVHRLLVLMG